MRPQGSLNHKGPYSPPQTAPQTPRLSSPNHKHSIPPPNHSLSTWLSSISKAQHPPISCLSSFPNPHTCLSPIPPPKHMHPASIILLSSFTPFTHQNTVPYPPHKHPAPNLLQHMALRHHSPKPSITSAYKQDSLRFNPLKTSNHQSSPPCKTSPRIIHLSLTFFNITSLRC